MHDKKKITPFVVKITILTILTICLALTLIGYPGSANAEEGDVGEDKIRAAVEFRDELVRYIDDLAGKYGISYKSIDGTIEFGINDADVYTAASTIKVPMNLYIIKQFQAGVLDPEQKYTYTKQDYEGGTGILQTRKYGSEFTIRELCKHSIEVSDNVATNILLRNVGRTNLKAYMREVGGVVVQDGKNISCPKDMTLYLQIIYDLYKSGDPYAAELMDYLQNTIYNDRIPKLLPPEIKVAHKIGSQVRAYHDVGIVFTEKPFIISVMTDDVAMQTSIDAIAEISKRAHDFSVN
ncbi:MAG: class A beta-lactamase-related serine hydrolase [Eubacteriales bacterium]|nr:class A beta-lactamase-related serine hydrolase [Eubacteriales bacterium]